MCVQGDVTEEDIIHRVLFHEAVKYGDEAEVFCMERETSFCNGVRRRTGRRRT